MKKSAMVLAKSTERVEECLRDLGVNVNKLRKMGLTEKDFDDLYTGLRRLFESNRVKVLTVGMGAVLAGQSLV